MRNAFRALLLLVLLTMPRLALGQVAAGTRVRVHGAELVVPVIGSFQRLRSDTLVILEDGIGAQLWSLPLTDVSRLERSAGMYRPVASKVTRGALYGGAAGALVGLVVSAFLKSQQDPGERYNVGLGMLLGAGVGAGAGAVYGGMQRAERWEAVPLVRRPGSQP